MPGPCGDTRGPSSHILRDTFQLYPCRASQQAACVVQLTHLGLTYFPLNSSRKEFLPIEDIIGCHVMRGRTAPEDPSSDTLQDPAAYLCVYSYPRRTRRFRQRSRRERNAPTFHICTGRHYEDNIAVAFTWQNTLLCLLRGVTPTPAPGPQGKTLLVLPPPRKLLILVNPRSGSGKAVQTFHERVVPLLAESDTQYQLWITGQANDAKDYMKRVDLSKLTGIVVVSGDGLLYEVFNGLMQRQDWDTAIKTPVGIVPCGSGNGLATSICHACGETNNGSILIPSVLNIVKGRAVPMDLVRLQTPKEDIYSFLSVGWGIMADIDIESEKLRALGGARFSVWALVRAIGLRKYPGRLSYLPVPGYAQLRLPAHDSSQLTRSTTMDPHMLQNSTSVNFSQVHRSKSVNIQAEIIDEEREDTGLEQQNCLGPSIWRSGSVSAESSPLPLDERSSSVNCLYPQNPNIIQLDSATPNCQDYLHTHSLEQVVHEYVAKSDTQEELAFHHVQKVMEPISLPPLGEPIPDDWEVIEGEFVLVYAAYQTHLGTDVFFVPGARLDDAVMWLVIMRANVSRGQVMNFLASLQNGTHIQNSYVSLVPVRAFRLEPMTSDGYLTVDGEVIECGPIQGQILPSVARVMAR